ncbi:hypothetical protein [Vreelandella zhaodongensis]|uniref:Uncharacterized protein n=1 Tax=Vreelandella zhaodongensis TaxID=1176240 RepID=A0ABX2SUK3_VREZH|nr:hypothetical protein [Halomonas zhaodongensis]NYS45592.1 hypothetical protein [Halomonas zhaodongensis]
MPRKSPYWIGKRPSDSKRWAGMTSATILAGEAEREATYRLYRRYVKQWNDIELDTNRSLDEHTHEISGAKAVGGQRRFILSHQNNRQNQWMLEVCFSRGFKQYYPGMSCGLNPLRSTDDIRSIRLHWSEDGDREFQQWLESDQRQNQDNGEWTEYKA